jgi:hypothetical protein
MAVSYYDAKPPPTKSGRQSALVTSSTGLCRGRRRLLVRVLALLLDASVAGGPVPVFEVRTDEHEGRAVSRVYIRYTPPFLLTRRYPCHKHKRRPSTARL